MVLLLSTLPRLLQHPTQPLQYLTTSSRKRNCSLFSNNFLRLLPRQSKRKLPPKALVQDRKRDHVSMMAKITPRANAKLSTLTSRMGFANAMQITGLLFLVALQFYGLYGVTTWLNASLTGIPTILDVQKLQSISYRLLKPHTKLTHLHNLNRLLIPLPMKAVHC